MAVSSTLVVNFVLQNDILLTAVDETATRGVFWSKYPKNPDNPATREYILEQMVQMVKNYEVSESCHLWNS